MAEKLLTVGDLATYLSLPKSSIYRMTSTPGQIPFIKIGQLLRFRQSAIDQWLESQSNAKQKVAGSGDL